MINNGILLSAVGVYDIVGGVFAVGAFAAFGYAVYLAYKIPKDRRSLSSFKKPAIAVAGGFALLLAMAAIIPDSYVEEYREAEKATKIAEEAEKETDINSAEGVKKVIENSFRKRYDVIKIVPNEIDGERFVGIHLDMKNNVISPRVLTSYHSDIVTLLNNLRDEGYNGIVNVLMFADLADAKGNEHRTKVFATTITDDTLREINFDNFVADKLSEVSENYYIHDVFK